MSLTPFPSQSAKNFTTSPSTRVTSARSRTTLLLSLANKQLKSLVVRTLMVEGVRYRDSDMSFHAGQETRAGERLPDEVVRAGNRGTVPRRRDSACRHVRRRSAFLPRSGHTVLLQP